MSRREVLCKWLPCGVTASSVERGGDSTTHKHHLSTLRTHYHHRAGSQVHGERMAESDESDSMIPWPRNALFIFCSSLDVLAVGER